MARFEIAAVTTLLVLISLPSSIVAQSAESNPGAITSTAGLHPNLAGHMDRPLRYSPDKGDFVITNGTEFFNRSLYGGNTAFRVDGGDKPEFVMYLPGRGGNLRLGVQSGGRMLWLKDAAQVVTRYRPGELLYTVRDESFGRDGQVTLEVLAYASTEGMVVRAQAINLPAGSALIWAYGGVNGQRGARDGDIGTERVPISKYFQLQPAFAADNHIALDATGFKLQSTHATIVGIVPPGAWQRVARAEDWNSLPTLFEQSASSAAAVARERPVVVGAAKFSSKHPLLLSLQRIQNASTAAPELSVYRDVTTPGARSQATTTPAALLSAFTPDELPLRFSEAEKHFDELRDRVRIDTPDPYLNAAMGALNVVSDALWDSNAHAIMHGSIAWRTRLLGWRGPYALNDLGWHQRARENFEGWLLHQNVDPIPAKLTPADPKANLARNEQGLHSNGDLSNSHYDMNAVFMDALFRHLLWTGDREFAVQAWPAIKRHIAWERRLFRREYGPLKLPLYEAYASIWASDDLYYNGGGSAYASAYNVYANRMAARIAPMAGEDAKPFAEEADRIENAMRTLLWLPTEGTFAEYKDLLGRQLVHPDYGLWNFYHTIDEETTTRKEAWSMGAALETHLRPIPVTGPGVPNDLPYHVLSETDWMPYSWSINNVVMDENMHTALALWQSGHSQQAYVLAKGALLASMFMGISPGNVGTMDYLDAYRRESQRDFGDSAGAMSRAIVEGLFGVHPDAIAGVLTVTPGLPNSWDHARLTHPDIGLDFKRAGHTDTWTVTQTGARFHRLELRLPAIYDEIQQVQINGRNVAWRSDQQAVGRPLLALSTRSGASTIVRIVWKGEKFRGVGEKTTSARSNASPGDFTLASHGAFQWWAMSSMPAFSSTTPAASTDWKSPQPVADLESVDLTSAFNDRVSSIFAEGKYLSPRSPGVSLALPSQGIGAWAGHLKLLPVIDDAGLRQTAASHGGRLIMPNGIFFNTPGASSTRNIIFTSQWDNYPHEVEVPLSGRASHAYLLMAGSTNFMQSHLDNGDVLFTYTDGTSTRLPLRNPDSWWPIEQDYFIDDYQFPLDASLPPRVDLRTGNIRVLDPATFKGMGRDIPGGAATVLEVALDPSKELKSITVRAISNDVVIGLMSATLRRPQP